MKYQQNVKKEKSHYFAKLISDLKTHGMITQKTAKKLQK